jgi:hypothetical protein
MFESKLIKSNHRPNQNRVGTYGASVFAHDDSITVLVAKICIMRILFEIDFNGGAPLLGRFLAVG